MFRPHVAEGDTSDAHPMEVTTGLAHRGLGQVITSHRNTSDGSRSVVREEFLRIVTNRARERYEEQPMIGISG